MALEEFERDEQRERNKGYDRMRSIMDYGMGAAWTAMGVFLVFIEKFNTGLEERFGDPVMKIFGGVCIVYGLFRVYRGYKKNYYRD
ncbi:MAG: hypothetical protein EOO06_09810 [Chitinophagaceae bacterium]|nr:MAG: hypothetical protein EOO06_09810 [Chitinophagaceae bacterium]